MRVKLAQAGEGGNTSTPFQYIYHHQQSCSIRSSWVCRYTNPVSSLVKIWTLVLCSLATLLSCIDPSVRIVTKSPKVVRVGPLLIFSIYLTCSNGDGPSILQVDHFQPHWNAWLIAGSHQRRENWGGSAPHRCKDRRGQRRTMLKVWTGTKCLSHFRQISNCSWNLFFAEKFVQMYRKIAKIGKETWSVFNTKGSCHGSN